MLINRKKHFLFIDNNSTYKSFIGRKYGHATLQTTTLLELLCEKKNGKIKRSVSHSARILSFCFFSSCAWPLGAMV